MNCHGTIHNLPKKKARIHFVLSMIQLIMMANMLRISCKSSHRRYTTFFKLSYAFNKLLTFCCLQVSGRIGILLKIETFLQ